MAKRGLGEGTICQRKDGRWVAAISLGYENGKVKRKFYYAPTRKEVSDKLTEELAKLKRGIPIITERQTVKQFLEHWLEDSVKPSVKESTFISYAQQVRVHIVPALGHLQLTNLGPQHIQNYMNQRLKDGRVRTKKDGTDLPGLSPKTVGYHRSILVMALGQALKWGLVGRNVAELVDPPRAVKYEIQPINPDQARAFLDAIQGDRLEALFTVALSLGLRRGEALGLRWQDIDFENRTLRINQSLARLNKGLVMSEPKTKSSRRVLDLPQSLALKLREHRTRQLEEKLAAGQTWLDSGLVFTTSIGTPLDPRK